MSNDALRSSYCIYSGAFKSDAALSFEHFIPKSLGGNNGTIIRVCKKLNSEMGTKIDSKIANDPMIAFGRRDANAKGHSGKSPLPVWKGARSWREGQPWGTGDTRFNVEFPASGPRVFERIAGKHISGWPFKDVRYVVPQMKIDSDARMIFVLKVLLALGWQRYGTNLESSIDTNSIRFRIFGDRFSLQDGRVTNFGYLDEFVGHSDEHKVFLEKLKAPVVQKGRTTMMLREVIGTIEISIACLGYLVGAIWFPLNKPLAGAGNGVLLVVGRDGVSETLFKCDKIALDVGFC